MRPWQTWLLFGLCLAVVLAAMGWLSLVVVRLDRAESAAIVQAAMEERVRLALWRMDSALNPLIAQESTRPYFAYRAFTPTDRNYASMFNNGDPVASPLLETVSPQVLVHFQIAPGGALSSPQVPLGSLRQLAEAKYTSADKIDMYARRLAELQPLLDRRSLMTSLEPPETQPAQAASLAALPGRQGSQVQPLSQGEQPLFITNNMAQAWANQGLDLDMQQRASRFNQQVSMQQANPMQQPPQTQPAQRQRPANNPAAAPQGKGKAQWVADQQDEMNYNDDNARHLSYQSIVSNGANSFDLYMRSFLSPSGVKEGMAQRLWIGDKLLLARRARVNGDEYIQGCWLDWPGIRTWLLGEIRDLLPEADIVPLTAEPGPNDTRRLAALPVLLVPGSIPAPSPQLLTPIRMTLVIAWLCVVLAAGAVISLLIGTMSLSERRAAFVSAVTHEMRTPLTTFRMYTEMLTGGMVPTEDKRRRYLDTLRVEAERLSHLVENVLAYARLERNRATSAAQTMPLAALIARVERRLADRAAQAGMELEVCLEDNAADAPVCVDASAVEQILFNLVDNACKYAVSAGDRRIHLQATPNGRHATVQVRDHGPGIAAQEAGRLFRPFCKSAKDAANSAPGVGLGLALSRRLARHMGGDLRLNATITDGACFVLTLPVSVN